MGRRPRPGIVVIAACDACGRRFATVPDSGQDLCDGCRAKYRPDPESREERPCTREKD